MHVRQMLDDCFSGCATDIITRDAVRTTRSFSGKTRHLSKHLSVEWEQTEVDTLYSNTCTVHTYCI